MSRFIVEENRGRRADSDDSSGARSTPAPNAYGLTRDELRYILDPADVKGPDYPPETFRVLKEREIPQYGEYRTRRIVLAARNPMEAGGEFADLGMG